MPKNEYKPFTFSSSSSSEPSDSDDDERRRRDSGDIHIIWDDQKRAQLVCKAAQLFVSTGSKFTSPAVWEQLKKSDADFLGIASAGKLKSQVNYF